MSGVRNRNRFVLKDRFALQFFRFDQPFGQPKFDGTVQQCALNAVGVGDLKLKFYFGKPAMKFRQRLGNELGPDGHAGADRKPPALHAAKFFDGAFGFGWFRFTA